MAQMSLRVAVLLTLVGLGLGLGQAHGEVVSLDTIRISSAPLLAPGSSVAWHNSDGNDLEIYLSDGGVTSQLTFNDLDDSFPHRSGSMVVWQGWDGNDWEIFQYDGVDTNQLTFNDLDDISAHISGTIIEWQGWDGNDWEIFQFDGESTTQVTNNDVDDRIFYALEVEVTPDNIAAPEPSTFAMAALAAFAMIAYVGRWRKYPVLVS